jgi:periplasmic divalent cation tolerance protein
MVDSQEDCLVVLCTAPANEPSAELARGIVAEQLAACVNIVPAVRSIYRWQGEVKDDAEALLVIKTRRSRYPALEQWIRGHHPYTEPEIIALPITEGSASYLAWIAAETAVPGSER